MVKTIEIVENERKEHRDRQAESEIQNEIHKKRDSRRKKDQQSAQATNWRRAKIIILSKLFKKKTIIFLRQNGVNISSSSRLLLFEAHRVVDKVRNRVAIYKSRNGNQSQNQHSDVFNCFCRCYSQSGRWSTDCERIH